MIFVSGFWLADRGAGDGVRNAVRSRKTLVVRSIRIGGTKPFPFYNQDFRSFRVYCSSVPLSLGSLPPIHQRLNRACHISSARLLTIT